MSDRRAVTAGRLAAPSVAGEMWRVAVGGNRVENMTVEEIAHAYHSGHLTARTPLWPPGTSGWQALGNFEQFQYAPGPHGVMPAAPYQGGEYQQLSQFQEGDDDPTRMWTGAADLEIDVPAPMPVAPIPSAPPVARPSASTGPRQISSRAPRPMSVAPARSQRPVSAAASASPSVPPFRTRRSSGWLLVAGLVGLVGLGSAVLAARGNWSSAAMQKLVSPAAEPTAQAETIAAAPSSAAPAAAEAPAAAAPASEPSTGAEPPNVNGVAKYEESGASAFVAGAEPPKAAGAEAAAEGEKQADAEATSDDATSESSADTARPARTAKDWSKKRRATKRSLASKSSQNAKRATASLSAKSKAEASEDDEPAPARASAPASTSVNEAAAAALASSAKLASSCRPRGGPSGSGKARIIYSQDGEVQSVEILTAKFRDTLTGSCVRMVFRRAKIPPFKGEPPTFIKSFTIPEE